MRAYESADVEALVELFTDDIYLAMPPMPLEYEGREAARCSSSGCWSRAAATA